jgi:RNA recognition motif-containing protein
LVLDLADRSLKKDNKKAIFVGNIHLSELFYAIQRICKFLIIFNSETQDNDVWEFFSECGQIESVRLVRDRDTGLGKGFGYVNFEDRAAVELALKKDGAEFKNRALRISRCVKKVKKTENNSGGTGKGNFFPSGKPNPVNPDTGRPTNKNPKKISQGRRQRKEDNQFSGDRIAEVGKFKVFETTMIYS